jgi:hypothetical protein
MIAQPRYNQTIKTTQPYGREMLGYVCHIWKQRTQQTFFLYQGRIYLSISFESAPYAADNY